MKTNLLKSILAVAAFLVGLGASAQDEKFYFGVTGYSAADAPATIDATVYGDLSFNINLPSEDAKIGASKAFVQMTMTGVTSLDFNPTETRHWDNTYYTGVSVTDKLLSEYLPNCFEFAAGKSVTVPVTVNDYIAKRYDNFTYTIVGSDSKIVGTPAPSANAMNSWDIITKEVTAVKNDPGSDSQFLLKKGAYLRIGNDLLSCKSGDVNLLAGDWMSGTVEDLFKQISHVEENGKGDNKVVLFLPAGSYMKVDASKATLNNDATITLDFVGIGEKGALDNLYNNFVNTSSAEGEGLKKLTIQNSLKLFDDFVAAVLASGTVNVTVQFGNPSEEGFILVYPGSAESIPNQTVEQFLEIKRSAPNAVGFVDAAVAAVHEEELEGVENIVIKYPAGKFENFYYESPKLVLEDKKDFYTPVDFIAHAGSYYRHIFDQSNTCCVPFALDNSKFADGTQLLTFAYYEPINDGGVLGGGNAYAYFNSNDIVNGGIPCFIYSPTGFEMNVTFEDTEIIAKPEESSNLRGTYSLIQNITGFYGIDDETGTKLVDINQIMPFRSMLTLSYDEPFNGGSNHTASAPAKEIKIAIINANGDATTIDGINLGNKKTEAIYTINGAKVSKISKPGLYIVNGVKRFVK